MWREQFQNTLLLSVSSLSALGFIFQISAAQTELKRCQILHSVQFIVSILLYLFIQKRVLSL